LWASNFVPAKASSSFSPPLILPGISGFAHFVVWVQVGFMAWVIGSLGIMMGTFVVVLGGDDEKQATWPYRKLGLFLLGTAVVLMMLTLINALILGA
jgi:small-conductance mechanosensitive channel